MPPTVALRAPGPDDDDLLFRLAADLDTWEERRPEPPAPLTRTAWDATRTPAAPGEARFIVTADGAAVGGTSFFHVDPLARHAEVGISLALGARGHGIGTEALRLLADFAFVRANLRRLHLQLIASNVGALRAYEKAGFVVEGRLREHAWVRGGYEDILLMGRLRG